MKANKIVAAISCTALIAAAALPLASCGAKDDKIKTVELDISQYATQFKRDDYEQTYSKTAPNGVKHISGFDTVERMYANSVGDSYERVDSPFVKTTKTVSTGETSKQYVEVYNIYTGNKIDIGTVELSALGNTVEIESYFVSDYSDYAYCVTVSKTTGEESNQTTTYYFYGEDGTKLYEQSDDTLLESLEFSYTHSYVNGEHGKVPVIKIGDAKEISFYKINRSGLIKTVAKLENGDVANVDESNRVGVNKFSVERNIAMLLGSDKDAPIVGGIADYTVSSAGSSLVFKKGGSETGRVNLENAQNNPFFAGSRGYWFVGNYLYYQNAVISNGKADKSNVTVIADGLEKKYDVELHKYDIVNNTDTVVKVGGIIRSIFPLYNYQTKTADGALIEMGSVVNGTFQNTVHTYFGNADLAVAYDVSSLDLVGKNIYKLGDNYLFGMGNEYTVVNSKLEPLSSYSNAVYYENEGIFGFYNNEKYGFADVNGNIIIEPIYGARPVFYNGTAYVYDSAKKEYVLLKSTGETLDVKEADGTGGEYPQITHTNYADGIAYVTFVKDDQGNTRLEAETFAGKELIKTDISIEAEPVRNWITDGFGSIAVQDVSGTGESLTKTWSIYTLSY